jgi:hypothetical protein
MDESTITLNEAGTSAKVVMIGCTEKVNAGDNTPSYRDQLGFGSEQAREEAAYAAEDAASRRFCSGRRRRGGRHNSGGGWRCRLD